LPRVIEETENRRKHGVIASGIDTGFRDLTEMIGGWKTGKLHVVGGRPGMGKSSFLLGTALRVAQQGYPVLFASAEMTKEELTQRALAVTANLNVRGIESGKFAEENNEWSELTDAQAELATLPLTIHYKPGMTVSEIRGVLRATQRNMGRKLGLVVVDYLQILDGKRGKGEQREAEVARLSKELTWLAGESDVAIIGASQLNRSVESRANKSKRPTMSDLRESGAIEQDAYTVTLLYRDEYYDKASEDRGIVEAIVSKNRGGPTGTVKLAFISESTRIDNLQEEPQRGLWETPGGNDHE
jgi:replicative DNA helicase